MLIQVFPQTETPGYCWKTLICNLSAAFAGNLPLISTMAISIYSFQIELEDSGSCATEDLVYIPRNSRSNFSLFST